VLVVADQHTIGVGRQRGLSRAREAEENGGVAAFADVGRAMHRHRVAQRQQVVHDGEHGLLDLAAVGRPADEDQFAREIDDDECLRARAVAFGDGEEVARVNDRELGLESVEFAWLRLDEEVAREKAVPRAGNAGPRPRTRRASTPLCHARIRRPVRAMR